MNTDSDEGEVTVLGVLNWQLHVSPEATHVTYAHNSQDPTQPQGGQKVQPYHVPRRQSQKCSMNTKYSRIVFHTAFPVHANHTPVHMCIQICGTFTAAQNRVAL